MQLDQNYAFVWRNSQTAIVPLRDPAPNIIPVPAGVRQVGDDVILVDTDKEARWNGRQIG